MTAARHLQFGELVQEALALLAAGDTAAAEALYRDALRLQHNPDEGLAAAGVLGKLATLLRRKGAYGVAEALAREEVAIWRKEAGTAHPETTGALRRLADIVVDKGEYAAAELLYREALAITRNTREAQHPDTAISLNGLAFLLRLKGEHSEARRLNEEALAIARKVCGPKHRVTIDCLQNLAGLSTAEGDFSNANALYREALASYPSASDQQTAERADTLNDLGALLRSMGDYAEAEGMLREALEIRRIVFGSRHPVTATSLHNLANVLQAKGDGGSAEVMFREALSIRREALGSGHPDTARTLNDLAYQLKLKDDYAAARPMYEDALLVMRKTLGPRHTDTTTCANNLAGLLIAKEDLAAAEPLYREVLAIRMDALGPEHPDTLLSRNNIGGLLRMKGDYAGALAAYSEVLDIRRRSLGLEHPSTVLSMNNVSAALIYLGDYSKAEALTRETLAVRRKILGSEHPLTLSTMSNLAHLLRARGELGEAEPLSREVLASMRNVRGPEHRETALAINNLAALLREKGDWPAAVRLLREALVIRRAVLGAEHSETAQSLLNLGTVLHDQKDYAEAEQAYREALAIFERAVSRKHPHTAQNLNNLAKLLVDRNDYSEAEAMLREVLEIRIEVLGRAHPDTAATLYNLAALLHEKGNGGEAESLYYQALAIHKEVLGRWHPTTAVNENGLALLLHAKGDHELAEELAWDAEAIVEHHIALVLGTSAGRARLSVLEREQASIDRRLSGCFAAQPMRAKSVVASLGLILRRKALGLEAASVQQATLLDNRYPDLRQQTEELRALNGLIVQAELSGPVDGNAEAYQARLGKWRQEAEELERELAASIPEMRLESRLRSVEASLVASHLRSDAALIEYVCFRPHQFHAVPARGEKWWGQPRYAAFVLRPAANDGQPEVTLHDLGLAGEIEELVRSYRSLMTSASARKVSQATAQDLRIDESRQLGEQREVRDAGVALRARVLDPLLGVLEDASRLILAPDGELGRFGFEALPLDDGSAVLDRYLVSYVGSGRDVLRWDAERASAAQGSLIVADPDYWSGLGAVEQATAFVASGTASLGSAPLRPLPHARSEGEVVAGMLGCALVTGSTATKSRVTAVASPRILHIASHGTFLGNVERAELPASADASIDSRRMAARGPQENPMHRSMLAFAGANVHPLVEGYLTAAEVAALDLRGTELVVLSACDTGLGEARVGEGVFGLQRAFTLAGAATLVMSLWEVPDEATKELMIAFYRRVLSGEGRAEALRGAQLEIRMRWPEPYYWAGFVCQGNPGPIR